MKKFTQALALASGFTAAGIAAAAEINIWNWSDYIAQIMPCLTPMRWSKPAYYPGIQALMPA